MGTYTIETIPNDFDAVLKGYDRYLSEEMKEIAIKLIQRLPDNEARDRVISHLLYAAEFIKISIIKGLTQDISE